MGAVELDVGLDLDGMEASAGALLVLQPWSLVMEPGAMMDEMLVVAAGASAFPVLCEPRLDLAV